MLSSQNQVKRIDGDFVIRTCWEAQFADKRYESANGQDLKLQKVVLTTL
jgi:hypothetical protein